MVSHIVPAVIRVLMSEEKARVNENFLALRVYRELGVAFTDEQIAQMETMPNFSSINRIRARLQRDGRFRPSEAVWTRRRRNGRKQK